MKLAWWMVGVCVASWAAAAALVEPRTEVLLGMVGPLAVASVTYVLAERTYRRNPERLTPLLLKAFAGKMVFFGVYVTVMLGVLPLRPIPFVVSFVSYFIALHLMEAFGLRHLFAEGVGASG